MMERDYTFNVMASLLEESRIIHLGDGCSMFDAAKALTSRYSYSPCPMCDVLVTLHKLDADRGTAEIVASLRGLIVWRDKVQGSDRDIAQTLNMHNLHPALFEGIFAEMNRQQSDVCFCICSLNAEDDTEGSGAATFLVMTLRWLLSQSLNTNIDMLMCNIGLPDCLFDSVKLSGSTDPVTKKTVWSAKFSDDIFDGIVDDLNKNVNIPDDATGGKSQIGRVLDTAIRHMGDADKISWAADMVAAFDKDPCKYVDDIYTVWEATYVKMLHILGKCGFKHCPDGDAFMHGNVYAPGRFCYVLNYRKDFKDDNTGYFKPEEQNMPVQEEIVLGSDMLKNNPDW